MFPAFTVSKMESKEVLQAPGEGESLHHNPKQGYQRVVWTSRLQHQIGFLVILSDIKSSSLFACHPVILGHLSCRTWRNGSPNQCFFPERFSLDVCAPILLPATVWWKAADLSISSSCFQIQLCPLPNTDVMHRVFFPLQDIPSIYVPVPFLHEQIPSSLHDLPAKPNVFCNWPCFLSPKTYFTYIHSISQVLGCCWCSKDWESWLWSLSN